MTCFCLVSSLSLLNHCLTIPPSKQTLDYYNQNYKLHATNLSFKVQHYALLTCSILLPQHMHMGCRFSTAGNRQKSRCCSTCIQNRFWITTESFSKLTITMSQLRSCHSFFLLLYYFIRQLILLVVV